MPDTPVENTQPLDTSSTLPVSSIAIRSRVAQEIAVGLLTATEIAEQFGLEYDQMFALLQNDSFKELVVDAKAAWGGGLASKERTRAKANMIVEEGLLVLNAMIQDEAASDATRLDALKTAVSVSDHSSKARAAENGEDTGGKFALTVNLANGAQPIVIETTIPPKELEDE